MKELKKVSRWIKIDIMYVTPKHKLFCYVDKDEVNENGKYPISCFRHDGRLYALNQFFSRFGMMGFDFDCKEYPAYITGYDAERYFDNLYCELDEYGEKIRLWKEV